MALETLTLTVTGMTCGNCVKHATSALTGVAGVRSAAVTLDPGRAVVTHDGADTGALIAALAEEGYTGQPA
ncbi:heavy-metal-associated domain-containing protein [Mesobacterium pallidum]|uniref:heavy-metal-associated domain-containing protein n=1 Tax=Mesobacterium pallidum TaxID=2872037 RepID=UPI001EE32105|nr:heavy-metal-associated domain-containing protein [Mesobacterium pallidum]